MDANGSNSMRKGNRSTGVVFPLTPNPSPALGRGEPKVVGREYRQTIP